MIPSDRQQLYEFRAQLCRALGSPTRMEIMDVLRDRSLSVGEIAARIQHPQTVVSQNLSVLRNAGLVIACRDGSSMLYRLANAKIMGVCDLMQELLTEQAEKRAGIVSSVTE